MGFLSTGMVIGLEEGFRTKQEEIADRQNQLTKDYRNEMKASIAKANNTIRTDRKKDEELLTISKGIISSISEDLPGLANKLKDLDQDTLIELGNTYLPLVKIEGASAETFKRYGHDLEKTIGTVLARDKQIREEKAKAAEMKTVEQQTQESFLDMFSPTRQGQIERDRINRGVTEEQREVMGREGAPKERRIIEGVAPQARERLSPSERSRFVKDSQSNITNIDREKLPSSDIENAQIVAATLIDLSEGDISRDDASLIDRYIEKLIDQNIKFTPENTRKIREDIRDRGANTVLSEIKEGNYKLPDTKPESEQKVDKGKADPPKGKDLSLEGLTKIKNRTDKEGENFIEYYEDLKTSPVKVFKVTKNDQGDVIDKVPQ
jgi:hypothetical protein